MIGLVIADDEQIIRQGLARLPWGGIGVEVKGIASNGMEALKLLHETKADIILTDIRMPDLDGIELIRAINRELPGIKTILLTGYHEFQYAYSAIKYGAFEFILKPTDPDEVIEIVGKAKREIEDREKQVKNQMALFEKYLRDLLYGKIAYSTEIEELEELKDICPLISDYVVMVMELKISEVDDEASLQDRFQLLQKVDSLIRSSIAPEFHKQTLIANHRMLCIVIGLSESAGSIKERSIQIASNLEKVIMDNLCIPVSIGISSGCEKISELNSLFREAIYCLNMKFTLAGKHIIHKDDIVLKPESPGNLPVVTIHEILGNIRVGNYRQVEVLTRLVLDDLSSQKNVKESIIKDFCIELVSSAFHMTSEKGIKSLDMEERLSIYNKINTCDNIELLARDTYSLLSKVMDSLNLQEDLVVNRTVDECLSYIEQHYMKDISLVSVARNIHRSPIYLSRLIKKVHGRNFLEILTEVRMNKACELLKNLDLKIYEVSDTIGIRDSRYFSQVFRKRYGVTPTEFRNNILTKHTQKAGE